MEARQHLMQTAVWRCGVGVFLKVQVFIVAGTELPGIVVEKNLPVEKNIYSAPAGACNN